MLLMFFKLQEESRWCRWTVVVVDERSRHPCAHHFRPLPTRLGGLHCNLRGGQGVARDGGPSLEVVPTENARACADVSKREIAMGDAAWDRIHRRDVTEVGDTREVSLPAMLSRAGAWFQL